MQSLRNARRRMWMPALLATICLHAAAANAQIGAIGGIYIDPQGMLRDVKTLPENERAKLLEKVVGAPAANERVLQASTLRRVSLKQWEAQVQKYHEAGESLPEDVRYLAGLTRIQYVVFVPGEQDVIIAGPAEAWQPNATGDIVGNKSGRPVLHADDLCVALRYAFPANGSTIDAFMGCSIDPQPAGVTRFNAYLAKLRNFDRRRLPQIFAGMEQAMGPQDVRLFGVPEDSRFASSLVAADYRLKRLAMGHDPSPVPAVKCYLDLAAKRFRGGAQPQHRWWFIAGYDTIFQTADGLSFEFDGIGVRVATARTEAAGNNPAAPAAEAFAKAATENYSELAGKIPVFADLQNLISLAAVAQLIAEKQSQANAAHWRPAHLLQKACPLTQYPVPKHVPSLASYRLVGGRHWLISVSGGVELNTLEAIHPDRRKPALRRRINQSREDFLSRGQADPSWWWDEK